MTSKLRQGLMLLFPMAFMLQGCGLFVSAPPIMAAPSACSSLLPSEWRAPVPGAPVPGGETVGEWIAFGDAQTAQLDKANDRTQAAIGIVERCEARDREAVKKAKRRLF